MVDNKFRAFRFSVPESDYCVGFFYYFYISLYRGGSAVFFIVRKYFGNLNSLFGCVIFRTGVNSPCSSRQNFRRFFGKIFPDIFYKKAP